MKVTTKIYARILAYLLRADLISESYVPFKEMREIRSLVKRRLSIVKARTMVKNKVYAIINRNGLKHKLSGLFSKAGMKWLKEVELPMTGRCLMTILLTFRAWTGGSKGWPGI